MLVTALEASQDVLKWALVTEQLLYEENKMREKQTGGAESKAMTSKHHIDKKGPKCFHCGKFGHLKCNYSLLGEDSKESVKRDYPKKKAFLTTKTKVESSCSKKGIKFCEPCVDGKHHCSSFPKSGSRRATKLLEIMHSDVCGRLEAKSLSGAEYFVTFIDDKSRYVWIYILKNKSEVFKKFL